MRYNTTEKVKYPDIKKLSAVTIHNGRFHADDVLCAALCQLINPEIKIIRTRNPEEFEGLCCDVGGGVYDHHPAEGQQKEKRKNGVYYAAIGKLWRDVGVAFCQKVCSRGNAIAISAYVDKYFLEPIDAKDNGLFGYKGYPRTICIPDIGVFNKISEEEDEDECFQTALSVAKSNLLTAVQMCRKYIIQDAAIKEAEEIVERAANKNLYDGVLFLPQSCMWEQPVSALGKKCLMVVMPEKGGYVAYGVPNDGSGTIRRCYFPKEWAIGIDAKKASGIPQMTFCYNPSGFMASFRGPGAKDAAIKACRIAVAKWRGETFVV